MEAKHKKTRTIEKRNYDIKYWFIPGSPGDWF